MRRNLLSILLLTSILLPSRTMAQTTVEPGDVVISGDAAGTRWAIAAQDFVTFDLYVVGFDLVGGVTAVEWGLSVPPAWTLVDFELPRAAAINIGTPTNVIASMGGCLDAVGTTVLGHYRGGFFAPGTASADVLFCLAPADPSSFSPATPGYVDCGIGTVPFGEAQNGLNIYPNGCLIVNPTAGPACPTLVLSQDLDDVLVPAGATATVAYRVLEQVLVTGQPGKTTCAFPSFTAAKFTIRFDPAILEWSGARLPARYAGFPLSTTEVTAGEVRVDLGPDAAATPLELYEAPRDLVLLDFVMNLSGGTDTVDFDTAGILDDQGVLRDLDPVTILVSDDPGVSVETTSFGAIKARFESKTD